MTLFPYRGTLINMKTLMKDRTCTGEDCTKPAVSKNVCMAHYMKARRARQRAESPEPKRQNITIKMCDVEICDEVSVAKGMCRRHYRIAWRYGLSVGKINDYESATECEICGRVRTEDKGLVVDHDHTCCPGNKSCGECVRGFICQGCNQVLGKLDIPGVWERFVDYLGRS